MIQNGTNQLTAKILILGESKVGKSSLLLRFTEDHFMETIGPTLGIDYKIKRVQSRSYDVNLQLWDTAGQERFKSIVESYYHGAHGVALVFDVGDRGSFEKIRKWMRNIEEKARAQDKTKMTVILIGRVSPRVNPREQGRPAAVARGRVRVQGGHPGPGRRVLARVVRVFGQNRQQRRGGFRFSGRGGHPQVRVRGRESPQPGAFPGLRAGLEEEEMLLIKKESLRTSLTVKGP